MASTFTSMRPAGTRRHGRRVRALTGPRLRPILRLTRGANGRPGGVAAPSVQRQFHAPSSQELALLAPVAAPVAAPRVPHAAVQRPVQTGVRLTERGMLAVLVVFGGLVAASVAVIVTSFFQVSNAPVPGVPAGVPAAQSVAGGQLGG